MKRLGLASSPFVEVLLEERSQTAMLARPGSAVAEDAARALAEALVVEEYLERNHPEWLISGGLRPDVAKALRQSSFVSIGWRLMAQIRCVLQRLDRFVALNGEYLQHPVRLSKELFQFFVASVSWGALAARGPTCKGTAGNAVVKALKAAVNVLKIPIEPGALDSVGVDTAATITGFVPSAPSEGAHMSLEVMLLLHELALSIALPVALVETARAAVVSVLASLRLEDLRRCEVVSVEAARIRMRCAGGKPRKRRQLAPFFFYIPLRGMLPGTEAWLRPWAEARIGKAFVLEGFVQSKKRKRAAKTLDGEYSASDACRSGSVMTQAQLTKVAWPDLLRAAGVSHVEAKACRLSGHAARHALADITMAAGWSLDDRSVLGRWAVPCASEGGKRTREVKGTADVYAAGLATEERELELRCRAIGIVVSFLGTSPWRSVVPSQRTGPPSFRFLVAAAGLDDVPEDAEDPLDEWSPPVGK